ncbi:MAG: hypothetical protein ACSHX8_10760 [Opitutaceae bacterium]
MKIQGDIRVFYKRGAVISAILALVVAILLLLGNPFGYAIIIIIPYKLITSFPYSGHYWIVEGQTIKCFKRNKMKKMISFDQIAFYPGTHINPQHTIYKYKKSSFPEVWDRLESVPPEEHEKILNQWVKWKAQQVGI